MSIIFKKNKELSNLYIGKQIKSSVYLGNTLRWQAIRSCFGNGFYINEKPWLNEESWKNN